MGLKSPVAPEKAAVISSGVEIFPRGGGEGILADNDEQWWKIR